MTTDQNSQGDGERGDEARDSDTHRAPSPIALLTLYQRQRRQAMRMRDDLMKRSLSFIRNTGGWNAGDDDTERSAHNARAKRILQHLWSDPGTRKPLPIEDQPLAMSVAPHMAIQFEAYQLLRKQVAIIETKARREAKRLPVWSWVKGVKGLSADTLARLIGELGDLDNYPSWKHAAKRMGLCPFNGRMGASWKRSDTPALSSDEWVEYGYCGRRRSIMHMIGESQIRNRTPYRDIYEKKKADELARTDENKPQTQGHAHARALVYMERMILRDLYRHWRAESLAQAA